VFVKICGITTDDAVAAAVGAGADALGFVFAPSPRRLAPLQATQLAAGLPPSVLRVAVLHHPEPVLFAEVMEVFAPDVVQSDAEDFAALALPSGCRALPVYRSGAPRPTAGYPDRLLFESGTSGSGETADWQEARQWARQTRLILAGGLDPGNVASAIAAVRPWGVDVSSGVEWARGRKDPSKIIEFVARARAAEEESC
jgi:phosphoribosylanthranilate isomerase